MMLLCINVISTLLLIVPLLITIAFYTLVERKIMASIQRRRGPNVTGIFGVLQPLADGFKLILNEIVIPRQSISRIIFVMCPIFTFFFSLLSWAVIPFTPDNVFFDLYNSSLFVLTISSLSVYSIIFAGWSSNSKYALLGALRSVSQMVSYEICISSCLICVVICSGSLNILEIVHAQSQIWYIFPLAPIVIIYYISVLAETNRAPFDLPEAEAEIVAGYNIEYSGVVFALFFLGEYCNMILMSVFCSLLFFGGWLPFLGFSYLSYTPDFFFFIKTLILSLYFLGEYSNMISMSVFYLLLSPVLGLFYLSCIPHFFLVIKTLMFSILFIVVRANLPRVRYDQLMKMCWTVFLPIIFSYILFIAGLLWAFDGLPVNLSLSFFY